MLFLSFEMMQVIEILPGKNKAFLVTLYRQYIGADLAKQWTKTSTAMVLTQKVKCFLLMVMHSQSLPGVPSFISYVDDISHIWLYKSSNGAYM